MFWDDVALARKYKKGTHTDCYLDPNNPGDATLLAGLTIIMWGLVIWCVVFGALGYVTWRCTCVNGVGKWRTLPLECKAGAIQ